MLLLTLLELISPLFISFSISIKIWLQFGHLGWSKLSHNHLCKHSLWKIWWQGVRLIIDCSSINCSKQIVQLFEYFCSYSFKNFFGSSSPPSANKFSIFFFVSSSLCFFFFISSFLSSCNLKSSASSCLIVYLLITIITTIIVPAQTTKIRINEINKGIFIPFFSDSIVSVKGFDW